MREINSAGLRLVKEFEGIPDGDPTTVNLDPYLDPVGIWTIGWGHAIRDTDGKFLRGPEKRKRARELFPDGITFQQAEMLLRADLLDAAKDVDSLVNVLLTHHQFSALVSFEFNLGALKNSTLLRLLNQGDYVGAAGQFERWIKGRNKRGELVTLAGLVRRRKAERALFERVDRF